MRLALALQIAFGRRASETSLLFMQNRLRLKPISHSWLIAQRVAELPQVILQRRALLDLVLASS